MDQAIRLIREVGGSTRPWPPLNCGRVQAKIIFERLRLWPTSGRSGLLSWKRAEVLSPPAGPELPRTGRISDRTWATHADVRSLPSAAYSLPRTRDGLS